MNTLRCTHCGAELNGANAGAATPCPQCGRSAADPPAAVGEAENQAATLTPGDELDTDAASNVLTVAFGQGPFPTGGARPEPAEHYDFLAPPQGPDEIGRLGAYRVFKVLGAGGMGVVFEAEDTALHRRVALKAMLPVLAVSVSARDRFLREARAAAAVEHPRIVAIYQVGEDRGIPFLVMPLLKGESLEHRLAGVGRLPLPESVRIAREIAEALAAAHERGLIHRDIKPANVW